MEMDWLCVKDGKEPALYDSDDMMDSWGQTKTWTTKDYMEKNGREWEARVRMEELECSQACSRPRTGCARWRGSIAAIWSAWTEEDRQVASYVIWFNCKYTVLYTISFKTIFLTS